MKTKGNIAGISTLVESSFFSRRATQAERAAGGRLNRRARSETNDLAVENPELKALLEKVRPAFVAHLDHAKQIQAKLK